MQFDVSYKKPQVLQALRYHFISRREIKLMIILVNVFAFFSAALFAFKKITPQAFLISSFLWFSLMLVFWFILPSAIYRKSMTFRDSFRVSLEDNHLFIENERGSKTWAWRQFQGLLETPQFFHLYFDSRTFFLLPKDVLGDSDRVHEVRMFLKERIQGRV